MASNEDYANSSGAKNTKDSNKSAYTDAAKARSADGERVSDLEAKQDAGGVVDAKQPKKPGARKDAAGSKKSQPAVAKSSEQDAGGVVDAKQPKKPGAKKDVAGSKKSQPAVAKSSEQDAGGVVDAKQPKKPGARKDAAGSKKSQPAVAKSSEQDAGGVVDAKQPKKPGAKKDVAGSKKSKPEVEKPLEQKTVSQSEVHKTASNNPKNVPMGNEALPDEQDETLISATQDTGDAVGVESSETSKAVVTESRNEKLAAPVEEAPDMSSQAVLEHGVIESESSEGKDAEQDSNAASADGQGGEQQPVRFDHAKWQRALFWMSASDFDALIKDLWALAQNTDDKAIEAFYVNNHAVLNGVGDDEMSLFVQFALNFNDQEAFKRDAYDRFGAYLLRPVSDEETSWCKKQWATLRLDVADLPEKAEHVQASTLLVRRLENGRGCLSFSMHWSSDRVPGDQDLHDGHTSSWSKSSMDKAYTAARWLHDQGYKQAVLASDQRELARNMWAVATVNDIEIDGFVPQDEDARWLDKVRASLEYQYKVTPDQTQRAAFGLGKSGGDVQGEVDVDEDAKD